MKAGRTVQVTATDAPDASPSRTVTITATDATTGSAIGDAIGDRYDADGSGTIEQTGGCQVHLGGGPPNPIANNQSSNNVVLILIGAAGRALPKGQSSNRHQIHHRWENCA